MQLLQILIEFDRKKDKNLRNRAFYAVVVKAIHDFLFTAWLSSFVECLFKSKSLIFDVM